MKNYRTPIDFVADGIRSVDAVKTLRTAATAPRVASVVSAARKPVRAPCGCNEPDTISDNGAARARDWTAAEIASATYWVAG